MVTLRRILLNMSMSVMGLFLTLFVLEGILILCVSFSDFELIKVNRFFEESPENIHTFHEDLGWVLKPNIEKQEVKTNSWGFRSSREYDLTDTSSRRVMVLGDSMVFGMGEQQEDIFTEILNREHGDRIFINAGVSGYSSWQEYLLLAKHVEKIRPDAVVIFHTQANDLINNIQENSFYPSVSLKQGELVAKKPSRENRQPLYKKTHLYRFLSQKVLMGKDLFYLWHRIDLELRRKNAYVWKVGARIFKKMALLSDRYSFDLYVVDIPTKNQLYGTSRGEYRQRLLKDLCESLSISYFDLRGYYPDESVPIFFEDDTHYNTAGHRFMAEFLDGVVLPTNLPGKSLEEGSSREQRDG